MENEFPKRFEFIIENTEGSKTKFARGTGKTPAQITDICKGRGKPTFDYLLSLNVKYGVNVNWLLSGEGTPFLDGSQQVVMYPGNTETDKEVSWHKISLNDFILVPKYDVHASAGYGSVIQSEQVVDYLAFKRDWVNHDLRTDPSDLALITVDGDSMEPTIRHGDLILVDLSQTTVKKDSIYVLRLEDVLVAKRLQRIYDGSLVIRSDNPAYKEQIVPKEDLESLQIIGRVIWFGRQML